jgi:hypothetical protein
MAMRPRNTPDPDRFLRIFGMGLSAKEITHPTDFVRRFVLPERQLDVLGVRNSINTWKDLQAEVRRIEKMLAAALAQVTGARLSYANRMEMGRTIRADRMVEGVDPGIARATGQITARFADTTLLTQAQNGTPAEFAFAFTIDANRSLTFTLHEVYLALAKIPIEGPAGVEASFDFRAAFNATATRMMTAVLKNTQAGTEYA